jgi:hypothetical protein
MLLCQACPGHVPTEVTVTSSPLSSEEIRAAAEVHRELGPDYQSAVIESFLDRVGREIDARVDARISAGARPSAPLGSRTGRPPRQVQPTVIALGSMVLGIPLSAVAAAAGAHPAGFWGLLVVWIAIAVINIAYAFRLRSPDGRR